MVYSGYVMPTNKVAVQGTPNVIEKKLVGTVTHAKAGRYLMPGDYQDEIKVCDGVTKNPQGMLGFEQGFAYDRPVGITTAYALNAQVPVLDGDFRGVGEIAAGFNVAQGDNLMTFSNGYVVPCEPINGALAYKIPFTKNTTEKDTGIDLPSGIRVIGAGVRVVTAASGATIDFGMLSTEASGDADGFLDGASLAATGMVADVNGVAVGDVATITVGELIGGLSVDGTTNAGRVGKSYVCDGTTVSLSYTTSDHTVAGFLYLAVEAPGAQLVGRAEANYDATSAAKRAIIKNLI